MGLVAQALDEVEDGIAGLEHPRLGAGPMEMLAAGVAVGALGDADDGEASDTEAVEHGHGAPRAGPCRRR